MRFIPVCRPYLTGTEKVYVSDALETGWISSAGKYIERFEQQFSSFVGSRYGVACSNGTAAVYLALQAAGVGKGDKVVVPSFTMMASVFPIIHLGADPIFVDCDPNHWTLNPAELEKIKGPVKAVMPVPIYGHPCDMDPIVAWAAKKGAVVIEDAAEAHGALYKGRPVGSLGDIAAFSFYANKVLTTGEGGMVTTNNEAFAKKAAYYRNLCFSPDPAKRFIHEDVGHNFRMTNLHAAIGCAQMDKADELVNLRINMAQRYLKRLKHLQEHFALPVQEEWAKNVYWMFGIVLRQDSAMSAEALQRRLGEFGVDTRRFFFPGHLQPVFKEFGKGIQAPVSENLWNKGIYLPSSSDLTDDEMDQVVSALETIFLKK